MMRWTGRRSNEDEEQWAGTTIGDPLPSDETSAPPTKRSAMRAFMHRFLSPRWTASETLTEKTWGDEMEDLGEKPRRSIDEYKGQFNWVVVDNDLHLPQQPKSNIEAEQEIEAMPPPSRAASISTGQGAASSAFCMGGRILKDEVWPFFKSFAHMSFPDHAQERAFQHERWQTSKAGACAGAFFLGLSTVLSIAFTKRWTAWNYYSYLGIAGTFNLILPIMIVCNTYVRAPWVYQILLLCATWCWPFILAIEIRQCGFFGAVAKCGGRTFLNFFALLAGIPTFSLMTLLQNRALHLLGITAWALCMVALFMGQPKADLPMWRNVILASVYHHILVWAAFFRERADRQLFTLRSQLKAQYRAVQAAQEMERRALESKRQFFSYIFHEVRVPLNTARLALANLHAEGAFLDLQTDQRDLILGLDSSMRLMEKVLNDVLSFNKMEDWRLAFSRAPFSLHSAVNEAALLHRAAAEAASLDFQIDLDERIDALGAIVGDELRVRQVCSNLLSNAFKFTQQGGVRLVTKLLHSDYTHPRAAAGTRMRSPSTGTMTPAQPSSDVSVRIEVHDTGAGLSLADMQDNRLFSPYVQTEIGRRQGGKGSGLGLALVTQIVKLAGGRLGVDSEPGHGSTFWFELSFPLSNDAPTHAPQESLPLTFPGSLTSPCGPGEDPRFPMSVTSRSSYERRESLTAVGEDIPLIGPVRSGRSGRPPTPRGLNLTALPLASASIRRAVRHVPRLSSSTGLNTLVVDDDELTRDLMLRTVRRLGHQVTLARNGMEALRVLKAAYEDGNPIDIVFLDNQMPAMSGVETARAIRALQWDVYIVGCTGNALQEDQDEYRQAGADAIVTKPVSVAAIREKLDLVRTRV